MNEQDTAAADAILLMEAEEKVKLRILQVVLDVVSPYNAGNLIPDNYQSALNRVQGQLNIHARQQAKIVVNQVRVNTTLDTNNIY